METKLPSLNDLPPEARGDEFAGNNDDFEPAKRNERLQKNGVLALRSMYAAFLEGQMAELKNNTASIETATSQTNPDWDTSNDSAKQQANTFDDRDVGRTVNNTNVIAPIPFDDSQAAIPYGKDTKYDRRKKDFVKTDRIEYKKMNELTLDEANEQLDLLCEMIAGTLLEVENETELQALATNLEQFADVVLFGKFALANSVLKNDQDTFKADVVKKVNAVTNKAIEKAKNFLERKQRVQELEAELVKAGFDVDEAKSTVIDESSANDDRNELLTRLIIAYKSTLKASSSKKAIKKRGKDDLPDNFFDDGDDDDPFNSSLLDDLGLSDADGEDDDDDPAVFGGKLTGATKRKKKLDKTIDLLNLELEDLSDDELEKLLADFDDFDTEEESAEPEPTDTDNEDEEDPSPQRRAKNVLNLLNKRGKAEESKDDVEEEVEVARMDNPERQTKLASLFFDGAVKAVMLNNNKIARSPFSNLGDRWAVASFRRKNKLRWDEPITMDHLEGTNGKKPLVGDLDLVRFNEIDLENDHKTAEYFYGFEGKLLDKSKKDEIASLFSDETTGVGTVSLMESINEFVFGDRRTSDYFSTEDIVDLIEEALLFSFTNDLDKMPEDKNAFSQKEKQMLAFIFALIGWHTNLSVPDEGITSQRTSALYTKEQQEYKDYFDKELTAISDEQKELLNNLATAFFGVEVSDTTN